jgi:hypothetical protein
MSLDRIFAICPYLKGSPHGVNCSATGGLVRNIPDIEPDICIGRHFELCHVYQLELHHIDIDSCLANAGSPDFLTKL